MEIRCLQFKGISRGLGTVVFLLNFSNHLLPHYNAYISQGEFLATQYRDSCSQSGKQFSEAKYKKKASNALKSSFVIALICDAHKAKNPAVEEICSVAMAVQNMHLVATAHGVGAYWYVSSMVFGTRGQEHYSDNKNFKTGQALQYTQAMMVHL